MGNRGHGQVESEGKKTGKRVTLTGILGRGGGGGGG